MAKDETTIEINEEEKSEKHKNYPFCDRAETTENIKIQKKVPKYDTASLYKYC